RSDRVGDLRHRHGALGPEGEARRHGPVAPAGWLRFQGSLLRRGIDLELSLDALLRQTDVNLARGFRAIKTKIGRARLVEDTERVAAMRRLLGEGFPLMADANM